MATAVEIIALLVTAAAVASLARRVGIAPPLALTVVGIVGSFVPGVPAYELAPELVLIGVLPPLVYSASIRTPWVDVRRNKREIALLSVLLVLVTAFVVALVTKWLMPELPFAAALALGAIVAPTDAVAAISIARRIGLPRSVVTLLEGESLLNDATALVTLRTALAALAVSVTFLDAGRDFGVAVAVGILVGIAVALVAGWVRRLLRDPVLDTTLSLLVPYLAYVLAEELHGSGVLAVVLAGLALGNRAAQIQSATARVTERVVWRSVEFLLESVVFLLVGLQLRRLVDAAAASDVANVEVVQLCIGALLAVVLVRLAWVYPATYLPRLIPRLRDKPAAPWRHVTLVGWSGMRGVVTLAAALALPAGLAGREALVVAAFVVMAGTLLVQGATLPMVARRLRVRGPDPAQDALDQAVVLERAAHAGLARLEEAKRDDDPETAVASLRDWGERLAHAGWERLGPAQQRKETPAEAWRRLRLVMLAAERGVVVEMRRTGEVPPDVLDGVLERLDQEEAMLYGFAGSAPVAVPGEEPVTADGECDHLRVAPADTEPNLLDACEDCLADDDPSWVHLRACLTCGHTACCDSSPHRHATAHYRSSGHPVMRSIEEGEAWRWCYVDELAG